MKNLIILLTILFSFSICAQKVNLEKFQLVSYDVASVNKIDINSYSTIDKNGKLDVYINGYKTEAYYSYQLNDEEIKIINKLGKDDIREYISKKELEPNHFYAGSRNYISFQKNKKKIEMCFILPLMNQEFQGIFKMLESKIYSQQDSAKISKFNIDFSRLEKDIIKQNKIDNYLPEKQLPPPPMSR
ncbi:hypothetical protein K0U91_07915 [Chryseobacterium chendengshani]|uniref:hypothetical protein n=1 Tax=Chryseobacterium sp. LJ668 TaxID=2864040 RepID=UPI001C689187|nr:hypothetical protein [Chryseobacterium sp. LJ668]MBW8522397.1 hypothetical protein [Chryseobacterium sp. LJ668]QYK18036.1 hypothetical protein K0U91_07915 [Chryseobacterium sp. LJ668]